MSTPLEAEVEHGFDPVLFWHEHKSKIILYSVLLIAGLTIYALYSVNQHKKSAEARTQLASAKTIEDYAKVASDFPGTLTAAHAQMLLAEKQRKEKKYTDSIATLRKLIADNPDYPLLPGAYLSLAETQQANGQTDDALLTYRDIVNNYANSYAAPFAALAKGHIYRAQGNKEEARKAYEAVISQFPDSELIQEASRALGELK